jgi:signal transduction histidine kinase
MSIGPLVDLIAKRARSLVAAEVSAVLVGGGEGLIVASAAGEGAGELRARRASNAESAAADLGLDAAQQHAVVAELPFRGGESGALVAARAQPFSSEDRRILETFATGAATTIASVRSAEAEKVKLSIRASEDEKGRWARELHDETLQELGALRFLLETAAKGSANQLRSASERALEHIDRGIENLRGLITELRPAALDELGPEPAVEALAARVGEATGIRVELDLDLAYEHGRADSRHVPELESAVYRLIQESVNNAVKHAKAGEIRIELEEDEEHVIVRVSDDGHGFDPEATGDGFGLIGMRERVEQVAGELDVESVPGDGTVITARLPAIRRGDSRPGAAPLEIGS